MSLVASVGPRFGRLSRLRSWGGGWLFWVSVLVLVGFMVMAAAAPWIAPYPPEASSLLDSFAPPSAAHWLGANQVGQDTLSRIVYGARTGLVGPLAIVLLSTLLGVLLGLLAGWLGGVVDAVLGRVLDMLFAFPGLLTAILAVALFGKGLLAPVIAMAIAYTPFVARLVRSLVVQSKSLPYVSAYRVQGFGAVHVALRRLLPNIAPTVLAQSTLNFGYAVVDLAALSFLGLGVQPPTADWGAMINEGRGAILSGQPLSAIAPAVVIVVVVVSFNIVGEELAERLAGRGTR